MTDAWQQCLDRLQQIKPEGVYRAWIKPLAFVSWSDSEQTLLLGAPNRQKLEWARAELLGDIEVLAAEFFHPNAKVQIELAAPKRGAALASIVGKISDADSIAELGAPPLVQKTELLDEIMVMSDQAIGTTRHVERAKINTDLTFENFVTGKANQMARAAAEQVAERPGVSYNPLFFYGGVGLGKTHLIHAVGNTVLKTNPKAKVRYIHAEQYVSDVVKAYQRKSFDEFKNYYHSLDLLLIDDIQFFAGKNRTQEEFFYAFEALANSRKQIIITSDTYPNDMQDIDKRLVSRFGSGLTVAIEAPELEMRVAILLKKAEQSQFDLPNDVAFFIAKQLRSNVRELEGALKKVIAFSKFHHRNVDLDLVKEALKELLTVSREQVSVETIQKTVADYFKIKVADMYSKGRPAAIALPRQVAMYLTKELTRKSLPEIGQLFGGRDHTTVLYAVRKITKDRQVDAQLHHDVHVLEQTLRG
jgi:chromosomal replication initiator protein